MALIILATLGGKAWLAVCVYIALIGYSLTSDFRSAAAIFALALIVTLLRHPLSRMFVAWGSASWLGRTGYLAITFSILLPVIYIGLQSYLNLALSGSLGASVQQKQSMQADSVAGMFHMGRIESSATLDLFHSQPLGLGLGVIPKWSTLEGAAGAIVRNGGSLEQAQSVVGTSVVHLHSIAGQLWYSFGIAGLAASTAIACAAVHVIKMGISGRSILPDTLLIFLGIWSFWDLLFSPLESNWPMAGLVLGISLHGLSTGARKRKGTGASGEPSPEVATA